MTNSPDDGSMVGLRCSMALSHVNSRLLLHRSGPGDSEGWVLPGGRPRPAESMASCVRREVREEPGPHVNAQRGALVLDVIDPVAATRIVDLVFVGELAGPARLSDGEPGPRPNRVDAEQLRDLPLRPPLVGYLQGLGSGARGFAAYLGDMRRPSQAARPADGRHT